MEEQCGFKGSKYPWGRIPARFLIAGGVAAVAGILVLFPFDWLVEVWPAYAAVFDRVFVNAQAHLIGHATLFGVAGLLVLYAFPPLRGRPGRYLLVMAMGAVGQEALQALAKREMPTIYDGRDLLLDLTGFVAAYLLAAGIRAARASVAGRKAPAQVRRDT
jgi:hypothetical protein